MTSLRQTLAMAVVAGPLAAMAAPALGQTLDFGNGTLDLENKKLSVDQDGAATINNIDGQVSPRNIAGKEVKNATSTISDQNIPTVVVSGNSPQNTTGDAVSVDTDNQSAFLPQYGTEGYRYLVEVASDDEIELVRLRLETIEEIRYLDDLILLADRIKAGETLEVAQEFPKVRNEYHQRLENIERTFNSIISFREKIKYHDYQLPDNNGNECDSPVINDVSSNIGGQGGVFFNVAIPNPTLVVDGKVYEMRLQNPATNVDDVGGGSEPPGPNGPVE